MIENYSSSSPLMANFVDIAARLPVSKRTVGEENFEPKVKASGVTTKEI
jgi:hypothetical protein